MLHWGLSEMGPETLRRAHAALPLSAVQNEYSMLWRGPEAVVIPLCQELGIGLVTWSPLGVGFLTGAIDASTRFAQGDIRGVESRFAPENLPHNLALVALVRRWAERKRTTPAQIALAWLMAQKPWIVPIPGTTQMAHMLDNIGAAQVRFTPSELAELNGAVSAIQVRGARLPDQVLVFSGVEAPPRSDGRRTCPGATRGALREINAGEAFCGYGRTRSGARAVVFGRFPLPLADSTAQRRALCSRAMPSRSSLARVLLASLLETPGNARRKGLSIVLSKEKAQ